MKDLDIEKFQADLEEELKQFDPKDGSVSDIADNFNNILDSVIEKHAPMKKRTNTIRPQPPWYSDDINDARKERRKAEKKWRSTGLNVHKEIYREKKLMVVHMIKKAKTQFYKDRLSKARGDQKVLFNCVDELLNKTKSSSLPSHSSKEDLANDMADFFMEKVRKIREDLDKIQTPGHSTADSSVSETYLTVLQPATQEEVKKTIMSSSSTTCILDPIPTNLLKQCLDVLLPSITAIINRSLLEAEVPACFKIAIIIPLLKKETLDPDIFKHYRPISNLAFLSKVLERIVSTRLCSHTDNHPNSERLQSSYKKFHSTETALVKIQSDALTSIDQQKCVVLLLLDLSAAFDTVDHAVLLDRLKTRFGIQDQALQWIISYFNDRRQTVVIDGHKSKEHTLTCNVPQGSVLGPKFFVDYESPLGNIIRSHGLTAHFYADDTQIYLSFTPGNEDVSIAKLEACVGEIRQWMASNFLKLNDEKTELIFLGTAQNLTKLTTTSVKVGDCTIEPSQDVRNIGAIFDKNLKMDKHVLSTCKTAWFRLYQIGKIRPYLSTEEAKSIVHAYVTSKIDQNNSLLVGCPDNLINKLQKVQNAAAKLIYKAKKFDHVTHLLKELHWLPAPDRITFKVLLLTYKALHGEGPLYLRNLLHWHLPSRTLRSADELLLKVPKTRLKTFGDRAFQAAAPRLWNSIPISIRQSSSTNIFKRSLKTHLFKTAYDC